MAKLNDVNPETYLRLVLTRIADHTTSRADELTLRIVAEQLRTIG